MAGVQFQPLFQAARNGAVPGGVRDGDVRDGAAHDGYGATHDAARGGAVCGRGVRDGVAPASDGAEQLADEVTEAVAALSPAEGVANGHPDTPSPTANPRQTARPSANKAGVCPVKKEGVGARAGTTSRQKAQTVNPCRR